MTQDERYMRLALELAEKARGKTSPNPMVGAVIVKGGVIVGQGYHQRAGTPHAEIHALNEAGYAARGATMYVTLEPCSHYGRTPPCADALIEAGIAKVVCAMGDPNPKVSGQGFAKLRNAGIEVEVGLLEKEATMLNEVFLHYITKRTPFVVLKTAATLDGNLATATGKSKWITGEEARKKVHILRGNYDAVLTGIGTIIADDPQLTVRHTKTDKQPVRIILDTNLRISQNAKILTKEAQTIIFTSEEALKEKIAILTQMGAEIITVKKKDDQLDIEEVLKILGEKAITSVLIEAGPTLVSSLLKEGLINKWYHFIAPKLFGKDATSFYLAQGIDTPQEAMAFNIEGVELFDEDIMLILYPKRGERQCLPA